MKVARTDLVLLVSSLRTVDGVQTIKRQLGSMCSPFYLSILFSPTPYYLSSSAFIFIPWWIYQYRGDQRILANHYDSMKNYVNFELGRSPNNIADTSLGDWDTPETSPLGGNPPEDPRVSATAFLWISFRTSCQKITETILFSRYQMLSVMSDVATVLNKTSDASTFSTQAQNVKTAFNNAFLNATTGYYTGVGDSGYRQTHNILALAFGLAPNASIQTVADSISQDVFSRGTHLNTGALGTKFLLPVLTEFGHGDTAISLSQQTTFPSWGYWIENGATTMVRCRQLNSAVPLVRFSTYTLLSGNIGF